MTQYDIQVLFGSENIFFYIIRADYVPDVSIHFFKHLSAGGPQNFNRDDDFYKIYTINILFLRCISDGPYERKKCFHFQQNHFNASKMNKPIYETCSRAYNSVTIKYCIMFSRYIIIIIIIMVHTILYYT